MVWKIKRSTRAASLIVIGVAVGLSACSTVQTDVSVQSLTAPLQLAVERSPADLRASATAEDAASQLAMAVVSAEGLHGEPVDPAAASLWRSRATASRGTTPITQYTAAFNGAPSRVNLIYVPRYEITEMSVAAVQSCIQRLEGGDGRCGSAEYEALLATRWQTAKRR